MPEHEAAPSPAGMLGRMDAGNSGSGTIFLLEQASLRDICYFFSLSRFPEEAVLAFIASLRSPAVHEGQEGAEGTGMFAEDLIPHSGSARVPCAPAQLVLVRC